MSTDTESIPSLFSEPISVSALNAMARGLLEAHLPMLWISGEISNFTRASSGHCYFVLKDAGAQVRCTLFRHRSQYLDMAIKNGDHADVRALPTLYEARGEFQLNVEYIRPRGVGRLFETFERLKAKLAAQGLFAPEHKKPLPAFARKIGVVTSPAGAALRDVLTTLRRRMPGAGIIIYPTLVQGEGAARNIAAAIQSAAARAECDVLIVCRGGGSIEDLWAFNEEIVAHAIFQCPIPVIAGIGHETDFTIADFVADMRAPTPTAAAELASPDRLDWLRRLDGLRLALRRGFTRRAEDAAQRADFLGRRLVHPEEKLRGQARTVGLLQDRLALALERNMERARWRVSADVRRWHGARPQFKEMLFRIERGAARIRAQGESRLLALRATTTLLGRQLESLGPQRVLERGYSIVWDPSGVPVLSSAQVSAGTALSIQFAQGRATAMVSEKE
ncbi:MAG: exodeoxyribonuclease VII large subunit [Betaproteobacteria bacterium]|nr:exodeoxyribonuclease VII large subunit [Betaproteobacteria bacterium]